MHLDRTSTSQQLEELQTRAEAKRAEVEGLLRELNSKIRELETDNPFLANCASKQLPFEQTLDGAIGYLAQLRREMEEELVTTSRNGSPPGRGLVVTRIGDDGDRKTIVVGS